MHIGIRLFGSIQVDYKLALNILGVLVFAALLWLTARRGAIDPVCGMAVDRAKAVTVTVDGTAYYFCSEHCRATFAADTHDAASHAGTHATAHIT